MKNLILILLAGFILINPIEAWAQKDKVKDYHLDDDIYAFNISHKGRLTYSPINEQEEKSKGGLMFCPGRFDWIMPAMGMYAYSEGTGLLSSVLGSPIPTAGFLEMGYGWMFNNKKANTKSNYVSVQYGMGVGFGFRQFWVEPKNTGTLYGLLWPEFSSIVSVGDKLDIVPKYIFNPIYSGKQWGLRTGLEAMLIYRVVGKLSLTCRATTERLNFNELWESDGKAFSGKARSSSFQFGFAINVASVKSKYSRD